jgi:hypothetical protein
MNQSDVKVTTSYKTHFESNELIVNVKKVVRSESDDVTRIKSTLEICDLGGRRLNEIIIFVRVEKDMSIPWHTVHLRRKAAKVKVCEGDLTFIAQQELMNHLKVFKLDDHTLVKFILEQN